MASTTISQTPEHGSNREGKDLQMAALEVDDSQSDRDRERLAQLGKKQVLKARYRC